MLHRDILHKFKIKQFERILFGMEVNCEIGEIQKKWRLSYAIKYMKYKNDGITFDGSFLKGSGKLTITKEIMDVMPETNSYFKKRTKKLEDVAIFILLHDENFQKIMQDRIYRRADEILQAAYVTNFLEKKEAPKVRLDNTGSFWFLGKYAPKDLGINVEATIEDDTHREIFILPRKSPYKNIFELFKKDVRNKEKKMHARPEFKKQTSDFNFWSKQPNVKREEKVFNDPSYHTDLDSDQNQAENTFNY